ncbi:endopeptidase La [Marinobacterium sp. LSUCC0821]|uniref:endopeptidase La n=1 Tax=Marinobacterium sp. LSUCC0821 TaxID=2668067 RepID=UPI00145141D4|nr:endopeptidase La [Marinobacterium sp. LSUCC0821]QJD71203.1 endopeptidase La [Marinobacterium sp. LSUCC0821]
MDHNQDQNTDNRVIDLPVLPLRDVVVYPHMVIPLFVGRQKSIQALEEAMLRDKQILLVAQRSASEDEPKLDHLFSTGTVATILQMLKLPDGTVKVLVEGEYRAQIDSFFEESEHYAAHLRVLDVEEVNNAESDVYKRSALEQFERYIQVNKKIPQEVMTSLNNIDEPGRLADTIAAHMSLKLDQKQTLLEMLDAKVRLEHLMSLMESEIDLVEVEKRIRSRVKKQMEKSQREYYLNEQMKAIQKELGDLDESGGSDLDELSRRIEEAGMPADALDKTRAEFNKLKMMSPMSAEATVVRGYIDWMLQVPWNKRSKVRLDMKRARTILDQDHYGLEEVKERILEYLAVQKRVRQLRGPILCLVGPPGVGKTSLGRSIAKATNREYIRMALGGVRDESEIRGHRRTYIGSMPGKLVQKMAKVGVKNPLFLLDEIDKMGMDHRGDPSSALLEVLDPEQNSTFNDHYLEVDYDLSEVLFICTSNSMNIPGPLLDRMEIIRIPGYTEDEKHNIARRYLVPKQIKQNGLKERELTIEDSAITYMIRYYTREAGVRGLEREISKICRKVVKEISLGEIAAKTVSVASENLENYLGVHKFNFGRAEEHNQVGQVTGLAWTQVGGDILTIESAVVPGKGRQVLTGSLGDVMKESIQAALTVVRNRASSLGVASDFHEKRDIHIHVPEGATPKDGPSAGIGMCTALVSALTGIPVKADVAMTGEITLRGQVLPIGGLKEKLLAAHRGGIKTVLIPEENRRDLKEIPDNIKADLSIIPVKWIDEVLSVALVEQPKPLTESEVKELASETTKEKLTGESISTH